MSVSARIFGLLAALFSSLAFSLVSAPSVDGDGNFLVYWTDNADAACGAATPYSYSLTESKNGSVVNTYHYASIDQRYRLVLGNASGSYKYELKVRRCSSSVSGGSYMASVSPATVVVGGEQAPQLFNFSAPQYATNRGFNLTWTALCCRNSDNISGDIREGWSYRLIETAYPIGPNATYAQTTLIASSDTASSFYRQFPSSDYYYQYSLCKIRGAQVNGCASQGVRVFESDSEAPTLPASAVGSTPYTVDVDVRGYATVEIPIKVPPGVNGLQPSISLAYMSSGVQRDKNSEMDYGWSIAGTSQIARCRNGEPEESIWVPDRVRSENAMPRIQFDSTDGICLDGQRLTLVSGSHWKVGAVYRTPIETFKRIEIKAKPGYESIPNTQEIWFEIRQPDGRVAEYGKAAKTQLRYYEGHPYLAWSISKVSDAFNNSMTYDYWMKETIVGTPVRENTSSNFEYRPEETSLRFRLKRANYGGMYIAIDTGHITRPGSIDVNGTRTYHLKFNAIGATESVQECGNHGSCLAPLTFEYDTVSGYDQNTGLTSHRLLENVTDGLGRITAFQYALVANTCYGKQQSTRYLQPWAERPILRTTNLPYSGCRGSALRWSQDNGPVGIAVTNMSVSNGRGGLNEWSYRYADSGRGRGDMPMLGFGGVRKQDMQTGVTTYTLHRFDTTMEGMKRGEFTYTAPLEDTNSNPQLINSVEYFASAKEINHGNGSKTYFPYNKKVERLSFEHGSLVSASIEENSYQFTNGFPTSHIVTNTTGRAFDPGIAVSHPWGDYHTSQIVSSSTDAVSEKITSYFNANTSADWRIMFESGVVEKRYSGSKSNSKDLKVSQSSMTPWANTMSIAQQTRHVGDSELEVIESNSFDAKGNLTSKAVSGKNIHSATSVYSGFDSGSSPEYQVNTLGHQSTAGEYDRRYRTPTYFIDPNGRTKKIEYDDFERVIREVDSTGSQVDVSYQSCAQTNCFPADTYLSGDGVASYVKIVSSNAQPETREVYDNDNRVIRRTTQGLNPGELIKQAYIYTSNGQLQAESLPYIAVADRRFTWHYYDAQGRKTKSSRPDGGETQWKYSAEMLNGVNSSKVSTFDKVVNSDGSFHKTRAKVAYYDAVGRLIKSIDGYGSGSNTTVIGSMDSSQTVTNSYEYDAHGNSTKVVVNGGSDGTTTTTAKFDNGGNRIELIGPNVGKITSKYNALGKIRWNNNAKNEITTFGYDKLGRLEWRIEGIDFYRYDYDSGNSALGLLTRESHNDSYWVSYSYDQGRLKTINETVVVPTRTVSGTQELTYDSFGRTKTHKLASGKVLRNEYSTTGLLQYVKDNVSSDVFREIIAIDAHGVSKVRHGNGTESEWHYDVDSGHLESLVHRNSSGGPFNYQSYLWQSSGNLQERGFSRFSNSGWEHKETFVYDHHDRLTRSTLYKNGSYIRALNQSYTKLGNIKSKSSTKSSDDNVSNYQYGAMAAGCTLTAGPHAVSSATVNGVATNFCYDANGAITRYDAASGTDKYIAYNFTGQPKIVTVGNSLNDTAPIAQDIFYYGPKGARYYKKSTYKKGSVYSSEEAFYFSDGTESTFYSNDPTYSQVVKSYVADTVQLIKRYSASGSSEVVQYLHKDHLGSVVAITDQVVTGGDATSKLGYEPFGGRRSYDWTAKATASEVNALLEAVGTNTSRGFTGHEHLDRTGFIHMNGRIYDSVLGRFLTPDPLVQSPTLSQSWNRYSYVWNNPMRATDPSGYQAQHVTSQSQYQEILQRNGGRDVLAEAKVGAVHIAWMKNGDIVVVHEKGAELEGTKQGNLQIAKDIDKAGSSIREQLGQKNRTQGPKVPTAPPSVDVNSNMTEATDHIRINIIWFRNQVRNKGPWDYKQLGAQYEEFGNFNYGATGTALGLTEWALLNEAGKAQIAAGTSRPSWGEPGNRFWGGGTPPYGDDPKDQYWIKKGIEFANYHGYLIPRTK